MKPTEDARLALALSDEKLRRASSSEIFLRGQKYAARGAVQVVSEARGEVTSVLATVMGSEVYRTEVWVEDGEVDGDCDCPSVYDVGFCKHQVAVALVWRASLGGEAPVTGTEAHTPDRPGKGAQPTLHEFLHSLTAQELAGRLMLLAERDPVIARELQQWRRSRDVPEDPGHAKALVTEIMSPGRGFIDWREGSAYVRRAEAVLPLLARMRERDPAGAVALCLHAMRRGWAVLAQADDSDGVIGGLVASVGAEWVAAMAQAGPQPAAFGDKYLQLLLDDPFGCFDTVAAEAAMGEAAVSRFRKALARRWREASDAGQAKLIRGDGTRLDADLSTLQRMYLEQLEAAGDVDGALSVLRRNVASAWDHSQVTRFLEQHGRMREAFTNAELALRTFPDDRWAQDDMLRCFERDGWFEEALALRWRQFHAEPSTVAYRHVLAAGEAAGRNAVSLRDELHAALVAWEDRVMAEGPRWGRPRRGPAGSMEERDVTLRTHILCEEARWDEALALAQSAAQCERTVLHRLAKRLGDAYSVQRLDLLKKVFGKVMAGASSPYREPLDVVAEIVALLGPDQRAAWLAELRATYKAKRNFVRDLPRE